MIIVTDTHLHSDNIPEVRSVMDQAIEYAYAHRTGIIHAGDVFDSRAALPFDVLQAWRDILDAAHDKGITIYAIPGNHDKSDYSSVSSYLDIYEHHPAMHLFAQPGAIQFEDHLIWMIPFFDSDLYVDILKQCQVGAGDVLITHIGVDGVIADGGIARTHFNRWSLVGIGHYHDAPKVNERIQYLGASLQHGYGETVENKGIIRYTKGKFTRLPTTFPTYYSAKISASQCGDLEDLVRKLKLEYTHVDVKVVGTKSQLSKVPSTEGVTLQRSDDLPTAINLNQSWQGALIEFAEAQSADPKTIELFKRYFNGK